SGDASADEWAAGTLAAAEAYALEHPRENEFGWKPAEERAQDEFWKNDPNRPAPESTAPPPPPAPEEDDRDPKNPLNKTPEPPSDPDAAGPDLPQSNPVPE